MPTYLYHCVDCGHRFDEFQSITEPAIETCPECKGKAERIITGGAGFVFKGSGFYITDHRSSDYKKAQTAEKSGISESSSSKPKPSKESKPAKKTESKKD